MRAVLSLGLAWLLAACGSDNAPPGADAAAATLPPGVVPTLAIRNVNVIPMDREQVLSDRTILIQGDTIVALQPAASPIPDGVQTIDGRGGYVTPGLADMHVHIWGEQELPLYLANGVTTVRNMWGTPQHLAMRERIASGELLGPTIYTSGSILDGNKPDGGTGWPGATLITTEAEAREAVAAQARAGYDFIKVYTYLDHDAFNAIASAALAQGIPFAGHVPDHVDPREAARRGMRSFEHLSGIWYGSLPDDIDYVSDHHLQGPLLELANGERTQRELIDPRKARAVAQAMAASGVFACPTLAVLDRARISPADAQQLPGADNWRYVSPITRSRWNRYPPEQQWQSAEHRAAGINVRKELVAALHRAGVPLLMGTDTPNPYVAPGFAAHDELALLVDAGLTAYEALQTATTNPAAYFGTSASAGQVVVGHRADLVIAAENPLENLDTLRKPTGVVLRGQYFSADVLQLRLDAVAAQFDGSADPFAGLPPLPDGEVSEFDMLFNGADVGQLRFVTTDAGYIEQRGLPALGQVLEVRDVSLGADGAPESLVFVRQQGERAASALLTTGAGAVFAEGQQASGEPLSQRIETEEPALWVGAVPQLQRLVDELENSEVAQKQVGLNTNGPLALFEQVLTLRRVSSTEVALSATGPQGFQGTAELDESGRLVAIRLQVAGGTLTYLRADQ